MKKALKKGLSFLLAIIIIFSSAFIKLTAVNLRGLLMVKAKATDIHVSNLTFVLESDGASYYVYDCNSNVDGNLVIPNTYNKLPVKRIGEYAFADCNNLKSVIIGNGITTIGNYAFYSCEKLSSITIPDSVTSIGDSAFNHCDMLKSVAIPDSVTTIGEKAFYFCRRIKTISMGNRVTSIGDYAFNYCKSLESITIPDSVTSIGDDAFGMCNIKSVYITDIVAWCNINFSNYNSNPLYYAMNLYLNGDLVTQLIIPDSATSIGDYAFSNCYSLISLTIPDTVNNIGQSAFSGCKGLESIILGNGITAISRSTFENCGNLTTLTIEKGIKIINYNAFSGCPRLVYVFFTGTKEEWSSICLDSNASLFKNIKMHYESTEHNSSDWLTVIEPNCTEKGENQIKCTICEKVLEIEKIPAIGHMVSDWIIDTYETCTKSGIKHKECTECKEVLETETIPALGHTSTNWIIDSQASTNAPGKKHKECTTCGEVLETATITQLKPSTPKVTTTNEIGGVNVTWNKVDGAVKYNVYRRQGGYSTWTLVGTTTGNTLLDKNVKSGIYYVYSVRAYNVSGGYSDFVSANTNTRKYMAVPQLTGISNDTNGLYIKWNPVSGVTNGYRVYRRGAGSTYWTYLGTTKNLYFIDSQVKAKSGEYFRYTVIADGGYHSKFDTTGLYLRRLANPTLNSATSTSAGITVKWSAIKGTTGYYVYRKTTNSTWTRVGTVGGTNNTTFLDKTAKKGTTYTYTVKAVYGATTSAYNSGISCYDKY